jgi:hypothetical protein
MLVKIKPIGEEFVERFLAVKEWPEVIFTNDVVALLSEFKFVDKVYKSSVRVKIDAKELTHTHLPSQYFLYAVLIKEFAVALYKYMVVFESLKLEKLKNAEINQLIVGRKIDSRAMQLLTTQEQNNFFDLFGLDDSLALNAKSILSGDTGLRGVSDFFGSVILKVINVPDTSNGHLGKLIYALCEDQTGLYSKLENIFLKELPFVVSGTGVGKFANSVLRFLWNFDGLGKLFESVKANKEEANLTIVTPQGRLTSIFRTSNIYLEESDLTVAGKIRYFLDPIFSDGEKLFYLSTEWTVGKDSRLDLEAFKKIIEVKYPEFQIDLEQEPYILRSVGSSAINKKKIQGNFQSLPKPFLLLAGISGTGKSRFVKQQALSQRADASNYLLVSVRPDWHEPSDLLGYVTRIGAERYVVTPFLKFIVLAWIEAIESAQANEVALKPLEDIDTYWACLDEMNLAPVEQYFADYLSVLESRKWIGNNYSCDALVNPKKLLQSNESLDLLKRDLGLESQDAVWSYFLKNGIPIPPNLIVAGTVNMDETTHGFSRKVIDRAFTIDFGEFFPTKFSSYFAPEASFKTLTFTHYSSVNEADLSNVFADPKGELSIKFLTEINQILISTPFEIAYRALNEMLVALVCFLPKDQNELTAVWDDFLMTKILPRIEGDDEKLQLKGQNSLLSELSLKIKTYLSNGSQQGLRPDLLRTSNNGGVIDVEFRSLKKIDWMEKRLKENSFTSFWP